MATSSPGQSSTSRMKLSTMEEKFRDVTIEFLKSQVSVDGPPKILFRPTSFFIHDRGLTAERIKALVGVEQKPALRPARIFGLSYERGPDADRDVLVGGHTNSHVDGWSYLCESEEQLNALREMPHYPYESWCPVRIHFRDDILGSEVGRGRTFACSDSEYLRRIREFNETDEHSGSVHAVSTSSQSAEPRSPLNYSISSNLLAQPTAGSSAPPPPPLQPPLSASPVPNDSSSRSIKLRTAPPTQFRTLNLTGPSAVCQKTLAEPPPTGPYFVYGTLMDPGMLQSILGLPEAPILRSGFIKGYIKKSWGQYPAIIPVNVPSEESPASQSSAKQTSPIPDTSPQRPRIERISDQPEGMVQGKIFIVTSTTIAARLAEYETSAYQTRPVTIHPITTEGHEEEAIQGWTFVYVGDYRDLGDEKFELDVWLKRMGR